MHENNSDFKRPSSKYQPKGFSVIYEDRDIIVINKSLVYLRLVQLMKRKKQLIFY